MDLLSLRYFRAVARHQHISRAAEELRVAQPSVSRTIIRLEAELGTPLFDRQGRRIRLNAHGAAFLVRVERALAELDDGRRELADAAGHGPGRVAVAAETLFQLSGVLSAFRALRPGVEVRLFQAPVEAMRQHLRSAEVDFAIASQPLTGPELCAVDLVREEVLLAVPRGHRLVGLECVAVGDLAGEDFVTTRAGHWQRTLLERLFAREGLTPRVVCEGDEAAATPGLIGAGLGVGLLPAVARRALGEHGPVVWLRLDAADCHRTLTLVWRKGAHLSPAARDFRRLAREQLMLELP
ncbi:LysR family transcriptional regulator [Streptomyces actinomycinicus]|uniref:LysR family transcriptional regulator n=1 Tax=Streptomyces actinomycinicus TaxID=1695166 RepID=A0A937EKI6_9ACTN|nr:LysR family transcriptional regulator [Streptomyces actinomycinicus]MBL1083734.1 LysR family transcriptional regulator [Streptomyces actinomycinicus]